MNINPWTLSAWSIALALTFVIIREHRRSSPDFALADTPPVRTEILAALLLIGVGLTLRFAFLGEFFGGRLTGDEQLAPFIYTSTVVHGEEARNGATHLTLALALDLWYKVFNFSPLAARALSATLGTISLIFFFLGLRLAAGIRLAMWSTAFLSVSLYGIYFSKLAFEIGWVLFIPPILFFLLVSAYQKRSPLLSASAGLMFSLGLFSYPGVLLATISVIAGMAISYLIFRRKAPLEWRNHHWWLITLAFVVGSVPFTAFALYQHFAILGERQALLMGGGALSFTIASLLSGWYAVLYDALFSSSSWYLIYSGMAFFDTALLPLGIYGIFMLWRAATHADREKRWIWYGLFLSIPICIAIIPFTGPYPGMRRALFVLLPYSVALGGGLIFLLHAITAQNAALAITGSMRNHPSYKVFGLSILMLAVAHPIAYQFTAGREITRWMSITEGFGKARIPYSFILEALKTHDIVLDQEEFGGYFDGLIYTHYPRLYKRYNPEADIRHKVLHLPYFELTKLSDKILMTWDLHKFDQLLAAGKVSVPPKPIFSDSANLPYWGILTSAPYEHISDTAYNLTDGNWINGIAIRKAGFFVHNYPANRAELAPGKMVSFVDGTERVIVKQAQNGSYLDIDLTGPPLDGAKVGFPNKFLVVGAAEDRTSNTTYNLTDQNWINGIAKHWAGFFVGNTAANRAELTPGKKVSFVDGSERVIIKQVQNGSYLNIDLSGPPLDGAKAGYPKKFKVHK